MTLPASSPSGTTASTRSSDATCALVPHLLWTTTSGRFTSRTTGGVADPHSRSCPKAARPEWRPCAPTKGGWCTRTTCASAGSPSPSSRWGASRGRAASRASAGKPNIWSWPVRSWATSACRSILRETLRVQRRTTTPEAARRRAAVTTLPALKWRGSGCYWRFLLLFMATNVDLRNDRGHWDLLRKILIWKVFVLEIIFNVGSATHQPKVLKGKSITFQAASQGDNEKARNAFHFI